MTDMLVRLWELPPLAPALDACAKDGVVVRRALAPEKPVVLDWVQAHFAPWAAEVDVAFARLPVACFVAVRDGSDPRLRVPRRDRAELLRSDRRRRDGARPRHRARAGDRRDARAEVAGLRVRDRRRRRARRVLREDVRRRRDSRLEPRPLRRDAPPRARLATRAVAAALHRRKPVARAVQVHRRSPRGPTHSGRHSRQRGTIMLATSSGREVRGPCQRVARPAQGIRCSAGCRS